MKIVSLISILLPNDVTNAVLGKNPTTWHAENIPFTQGLENLLK